MLPTHTVEKDMDVTLAGIRMRLMHIPGETADQMGVWLPDKRILLAADNIYKAFPNLTQSAERHHVTSTIGSTHSTR